MNRKNMARILRSLSPIAEECSRPDWNGCGAKPLWESSINLNLEFIEKLPDWLYSHIKLCAEPTGDLTIELSPNGWLVVVGVINYKPPAGALLSWGALSPDGDKCYNEVSYDPSLASWPQEFSTLLDEMKRVEASNDEGR